MYKLHNHHNVYIGAGFHGHSAPSDPDHIKKTNAERIALGKEG